MSKTFSIIGSALAFGAVMLTPVAAQAAPPPNNAAQAAPVRATALWQRIVELERDVNRAEARKTISHREAAALRGDVAKLKQQYRRYKANGISPSEARTLDSGIERVRARLVRQKRDDNGRVEQQAPVDHRTH